MNAQDYFFLSFQQTRRSNLNPASPHLTAELQPPDSVCSKEGKGLFCICHQKMHLQNFISVLHQPGKYILKPEFTPKHNSRLPAILLQRSASKMVQWSFDYLQSPGSSVYVKRQFRSFSCK